jgi:hypothetical protein
LLGVVYEEEIKCVLSAKKIKPMLYVKQLHFIGELFHKFSDSKQI